MTTGRTLRSLVSRRRRADDEEEEDADGPVVVADSQSEGSVLSDPDDDEGDGSSVGHAAEAEPDAVTSSQDLNSAGDDASKAKRTRKPRKSSGKNGKESNGDLSQAHSQPQFDATADTQAMRNGLGGAVAPSNAPIADFESGVQTLPNPAEAAPSGANGHGFSSVEQRRREHEEYKRRRDADPAFIPNRGNFFMHDTRGHANGQTAPFRGSWQGRGGTRGVTGVGGPFSPANRMALAERAAEQTWKHDLHDTVNEDWKQPLQNSRQLAPPAEVASSQQSNPRQLSFSSTTLVGKVQIRVSLPDMKAPVAFSEVPWKHYTRLPDHRPPLRRDKPVRIFLPGHTQRYIFPAADRSFIFIPRQNRPNRFGNQRGQYQRSIGGYGYSSRRTSMYGGSFYSGSVAPSRRSSLAGISRDNAFSPVGSIAGMMSSRPVVNLPPGSQHFSAASTPLGPLSGHQTPTGMPPIHNYPPPQPPAHYGTPITTVHHPRPQKAKAISIDGIESPMLQQDLQPFRNQLPAHMHEGPPLPPPAPYFSPQQMASQSQIASGTSLVGIPEQPVHAPAFPPSGYGHPPFYPSFPPPPHAPSNMYYPAPASSNFTPMNMYMTPHSYQGHAPAHMLSPQQAPPPSSSAHGAAVANNDALQSHRTQSGMVAHESNGMVFYVPASEAQQSEQYQPAESFVPSYAMPGLPPPTPPESTMNYYYPTMAAGIEDVGPGVYYPNQPRQS